MRTASGVRSGVRSGVDSGVDSARRAAAEILREKRFQPDTPPQPLRRPLSWLGDRLQVVGRPFAWLGRTIGRLLPGGGSMIWVAIVLVSLTVVVFVLVRSSKFGGRKISSGLGLGASTTVSADELERMAADAEREGDWAASVRLLFRAGLRRLADQHAVQSPDQRPNGEVARQLGDPAFGALVTRFDQVAYARAPASPHDVEVARRSWPGIVRSAVEQAKREREGRLESGHGRSETHKSAKKRRWRRRPLKSGDGSR